MEKNTDDPDNFAIKIQAVFNKIYKDGNGKARWKDILINTCKLIQYTLDNYFPKEYVKICYDLMKKRLKKEIPYGGFKWGMVKIYYQIKELKKMEEVEIKMLEDYSIDDLIDNFMYDPLEEQLVWDDIGTGDN
jgi:hypothetical protein